MKILSLLILFLPITVFTQNSLNGRISDLSGKPFNYCKLVLLQDSVIIQTTESDSTGRYAFQNLTAGTYSFQIKLPFQRIDTVINVNGAAQFNLEVEDENTMEEVVINFQKPTVIRKVDRTIFDPSNIPALVGGNASDVIEFAPGVYMNDDVIQIAGGSSAKVMLNDKIIPLTGPELISFIRSIPTEDIQYIEIIPIAPVKYAATIQGSLINIKLVIGSKSRLSKGSITADIGQNFYSHQGFSANYAYRKDRFSLYTNATIDNGTYHYTRSKQIEYDTLLWKEKTVENSRSVSLASSIGLNYELNSTTEIGVLALVYLRNSNNPEENSIEKTGIDNSNIGTIHNLTIDKGNNLEKSLNMNLVKRLDTLGQKIDFNFDYTNFERTGKIDYNTRFTAGTYDSLNSSRNEKLTAANFFSGGVDYTLPYKKVTFNLGARYSYAVNTSDLSVYDNLNNPTIADTSQSNTFNYYEQIQAAYSSLDWSIKKWSFQIGVRGENTSYLADSPTSNLKVKNDYFQLIPKVFAMYETKKGQFWNLNYSRNFFRPNYSDLNPFRYYTSAYSYRTGNPYLKPTVMHNVSVSTSVKDFQIDLSFGYLNKMQTDVTIYDNATQIQLTSTSNLFTAKSVSIYISYYKTIRKRTTIDATVSSMYMNREVIASIASQNLNNFSGSAYLTLNQTLDKKGTFFFTTDFMYNSPYLEQITRTTLRPSIDFEWKKNLLKNRMSITLKFRDPFRLRTRASTTRSNETVITQNAYYDTQGIQFSFVYKLGNKNLNVNQHSTNSTGEAGRVGN